MHALRHLVHLLLNVPGLRQGALHPPPLRKETASILQPNTPLHLSILAMHRHRRQAAGLGDSTISFLWIYSTSHQERQGSRTHSSIYISSYVSSCSMNCIASYVAHLLACEDDTVLIYCNKFTNRSVQRNFDGHCDVPTAHWARLCIGIHYSIGTDTAVAAVPTSEEHLVPLSFEAQ